MKNFRRVAVRLLLGKDYVVWYNYKHKKSCRFIQVTKCGYNLLNMDTNKCILKQHLYPSKYETHSSGDWFFVNEYLKIETL